MSQTKLNLLKFIDKLIGTPLCYFFGLLSRLKPIPELNKSQIKKILIVKWIGLGDVILSLPTIMAIRKRYPHAEIAYFTTPRGALVLRGCPEIDKIISYDITGENKGIKELINIIRTIKNEHFDISIELMQRYRLPSLITYLANIPHRIGFNLTGQGKQLLLTNTVPYPWKLHEVNAFGKISEIIDAPVKTNILPKLKFPNELIANSEIKKIIQEENNKIIIHVGVGPALRVRQWSANKFVELINCLQTKNGTIILTGALEDRNLGEKITSSVSSYPITNLIGKTTLPQLYNLFEHADLIISMDTGPMHLAAASGTPTLGIFMASYPEKWGPWGPQHKVIYHGPNINPKHPKYYPNKRMIRKIETEEVVTQINKML